MAQYIIPKARCLETGQTVQEQDLSGRRFQPHERVECQRLADRLAENQNKRSDKTWQGYCQIYTA